MKMKTPIKIVAATAIAFSASQALAFETEIERAGMLYFNIPMNTHSVPALDDSVLGFRFGQTRISTDNAGSLFTYFKTRPALFDVQFGMVGRKHSPDDIHFGLLDLKLTGISSVEKTYINGQAVVGGIIASKALLGAAAVGGIAAAAAASSSSDEGEDDSSEQSSSSSSKDDDSDDVAENEVEHEEEHHAEDDHDDDHEEEHHAEDDHDDDHEEEHHAEDDHDDDKEHENGVS